MAIRGHIDTLSTTTATGWAFDDSDAEAALEIEIVLGDRIVAAGKANRFRHDLAAANLGGGRCAFELTYPPISEEELLGIEIKPAEGELVFEKPKTDLFKLVARGALSRYPGAARYRSLFGGLWTDRSDAEELVRGRFELGQVDDTEAELLLRWIHDGYVVLKDAVPDDVLDRVADDARLARRGRLPRVRVEPVASYAAAGGGELLEEAAPRITDLHAASDATRNAIFAPAVYSFLAHLFSRPPLAFQAVVDGFTAGEPIHQDSSRVAVSSPLELVASWIPLAPLGDSDGELELYTGSQKLPEHLFGGKDKWMPEPSPEKETYLRALHAGAAHLGLTRRRLAIGRGDAVLLSADLAYAVAAPQPEAARDSLLTHYCPYNVKPMYSYRTGLTGYSRHSSGGYYCAEARGF